MECNTISVIGLGYIGLPTAVTLARHQIKVIGVDVCQPVVDSVNAGQLHFKEPGIAQLLAEVVKKSLLQAVTRPEPADAFVIAVPTPLAEGHKPDLSHIRAAAASIAPVLEKGNIVILESTSPVGTTENLARWLAEDRPDLSFPQDAGGRADVHVAYCPERILPGNILDELVNNDRVIGGMSPAASEQARQLYKIFVQGEITITDTRTAEMCKLTENSFRDVNIAFANELSLICDKMGIDVWELISLANKHQRVNILQPGCGVGGHCIPIDPWFIVDSAANEARLIRTAREVNDYKPQWVVKKVKAAIAEVMDQQPEKKLEDVTVACLGLTFKPDSDDLRNSPALEITRAFAEFGCRVLAVEPNIHILPELLTCKKIELIQYEEAILKSDIICFLIAHGAFDLPQVNKYFEFNALTL